MNNSNAAAKRRRAGIQPTIPPAPTQVGSTGAQSQPQNMNGAQPAGYTLPQVIALIDNRLITLENFMKETKESSDLSIPDYNRNNGDDPESSGAVFMDSKEFTEFVDDINQRFQLFADEINGLKEIVLKLQGFTMDVNKMLLASLQKQGEPIPNINIDSDSGNDETPPVKMELAEQTFVLESQSNTTEPVDEIDKAVTNALTSSSSKSKKR